jgi:murein DD-endopeptidase MepM/ murein hydrolase activator NlpD
VARSRALAWITLLAIPILLVVGGGAYLGWRQRVPPVRAELTPPVRFIGAKTPISVALRAAGGQVASTELRLVQGQGRVVIAKQAFPGTTAEQRLNLTVEGGTLGLREGAATLEVFARDTYWRPLRVDDRPVLSVPVTLDWTPPVIEVLAYTRYVNQGGGGIVAFRARGASRAGVNSAGIFLPAYPADADSAAPAQSGPGGPAITMVAMFVLPWNAPANAPILVTAQDEAGNTASRPVPAEIRPRRFPAGIVELDEKFFTAKLPELAPERGQVPPEQYVTAFLAVNRDKRKEAEQVKRQLAARTQPRPLWEGAFVQPHNSKVRSNFAESRSYRYKGQEIDTQMHMGYDLAWLEKSPVPAANTGVVVFAGPLTIYGNAVVIDHGLGLQTLYAHLSSLDVKEGDAVARGQALGRTGATGLALGDHLHYEVLIHGIPVTPIEWWDQKWLRDRIGTPLKQAGVALLKSEQPSAEEDREARAPRKRRAARAR